jgi:hypothetical protein
VNSSNDYYKPAIYSVWHEPNTVYAMNTITIFSRIFDNSPLQYALIFYRINNSLWYNLTLNNSGNDIYSVAIGSYGNGSYIEYYIEAQDSSIAQNLAIANNTGIYFNISVVLPVDTEPPSIRFINHFGTFENSNVTISADIDYFTQISYAITYYRINGSSWLNISMYWSGPFIYLTHIGPFPLNTFVEYYIIACDSSPNQNIGYANNSGMFYNFIITPQPDTIGPTILDPWHDQIKSGETYNLTIYTNISDPSGIWCAFVQYNINSGAWTNTSLFQTIGDNYAAFIGTFSPGTIIEFYITAYDDSMSINYGYNNNNFTNYFINITAEPDLTAPQILWVTHQPDPVYNSNPIEIKTNISDESGIYSTILYYRVNFSVWINTTMMFNFSSMAYTATIGSYMENSIIEYYVFAIDNSTNKNNATSLTYNFTIMAEIQKPSIFNIYHIPGTVYNTQNVTINANITDDTGILNAFVYYRVNGSSWQNNTMVWIAGGNYYTSILGIFAAGSNIQYYILAIDSSVNHNQAINNNSGLYYGFNVLLNDTQAPIISYVWHNPNTVFEYQNYTINANITDNVGIQTAFVYYRINGSVWQNKSMNFIGGISYSAFFTGIGRASYIQYYIQAIDNSTNSNNAFNNNSGNGYNFTIQDATGPLIYNINHIPSTPTTTDNINITVASNDPSGIKNVTVFYRINYGVWLNILTSSLNGYDYSVLLGPFGDATFIQYYIQAWDNSSFMNTAINDNTGQYFNVTVKEINPPMIGFVWHDPMNVYPYQNISINANITDDTGILNAIAYYRVNGSSWYNISMNFVMWNHYSANIGFFGECSQIQYYVTAKDNSTNQNMAVNNNTGAFYNVTIIDITGPILYNVWNTPNPEPGTGINVTVETFDNSGIFEIRIIYQINNSAWSNVSTIKSGNVYWLALGSYEDGTIIKYYFQAWDNSIGHNFAINNNGGSNYTINVKDHGLPTIFSVGYDPDPVFEFEVITIKANIFDTYGISNVTLYYRVNGSGWSSLPMALNNSYYRATIGSFGPNNNITYYIEAMDNSSNHNMVIANNTGLYYMIWVNPIIDSNGPIISSIIHSPSNPQPYDSINITATVTDISGIFEVQLTYRINSTVWLNISTNNTGNIYWQQLSGFGDGTLIEYYFSAWDNSVDNNYAENTNGGSYYIINVEDTIVPTIFSVWREPYTVYAEQNINIYANMTDLSGIINVTLIYRINGSAWIYAEMHLITFDQYNVTFGPFGAYSSIQYYVEAIDNSSNHNIGINNNTGLFYEINVNPPLDTYGPIISNVTYSPSTPTPFDNIVISVNIYDISGIDFALITYTIDGNETWHNITLNQVAGNYYNASVGSFPVGTLFMYYITAFDNSSFHNMAFNQNETMCNPYQIIVVEESDIPIIFNVIHNPVNPTPMNNITINADVSDLSGISHVRLIFQINGSGWLNYSMTHQFDNTYQYMLGNFGNGTVLYYYIEAWDNSSIFNYAKNNNGGSNYFIFVLMGDPGDITPPLIVDITRSPITPDYSNTILIKANITDISGISIAKLYYQVNYGGWIIGNMTQLNSTHFGYEIGPFIEGNFIEYYIFATDNSTNYNSAFGKNNGLNFNFTVSAPNELIIPEIFGIRFTPTIVTHSSNITIIGNATDSSGIGEIRVFYRMNNGTWNNLTMNSNGGNEYQISIGTFAIGTQIDFYIWAQDRSLNQNIAINNDSGSYFKIHVVDPTNSPTISQPPDINYLFGTNGNVIQWNVNDTFTKNGSYTIFQNGTLYSTGLWENYQIITLNVDNLSVGIYIFEIAVNDGYGNTADDLVQVIVFENQAPNISTISDIEYIMGSTQNITVNWTITDNYITNATYRITVNSSQIDLGEWQNNDLIVVNINSIRLNNALIIQTAGNYEIRIQVFDGLGLNSTNAFILKVIYVRPWTIPQDFEIDLDENITLPIKVSQVDIRWFEGLISNAENVTFYISTTRFYKDELKNGMILSYINTTTLDVEEFNDLNPGKVNKYKFSDLQNGTYYICMSYENPLGKGYSNVIEITVAIEPEKENSNKNTKNTAPFDIPNGVDGVPISFLIMISMGLIGVIIIKTKNETANK